VIRYSMMSVWATRSCADRRSAARFAAEGFSLTRRIIDQLSSERIPISMHHEMTFSLL
jgi:hypothetical protein